MSQLKLFVVLLCAANALTIPPEKKAARAEGHTEGGDPRGLTLSSQLNHEGKSSSKFFGGILPSFHSPNQGFFPSPMGGYNVGGFPSYPYPPSPYGYMNGPFNYGGFYPQNPGYFGQNFGGYAATQQQQQQQQSSQIGAGGSGMGGFQSPFGGFRNQ
ncbi:chitin synthase 8-like [Thrips palmi]|uniref:Chitin synthase 8-like n=1 Tax=Thrips palmi TaxID=161013 RepID=A0A6P8ZJS7_THRPL|nr:chitin synthase 8-like [Thrips palmi]